VAPAREANIVPLDFWFDYKANQNKMAMRCGFVLFAVLAIALAIRDPESEKLYRS
jgi:hypothetical protein